MATKPKEKSGVSHFLLTQSPGTRNLMNRSILLFCLLFSAATEAAAPRTFNEAKKIASKDDPTRKALFEQTDVIRKRLAELDVTLEDRPGGTGWRIG